MIERAAIQTQFENKKQRSVLKDKIRDKINKNDQQLRGYEDEAGVKGKVRKQGKWKGQIKREELEEEK